MVSSNFFTLWNIRPILGRTFAKDEATPVDENGNPTADSVVVLSYASWQKLFASDAGVIGKTIELSGRHFTVVGVMPPHFRFPREVDPLVWVPAEPRRLPAGMQTGSNIRVLVRLKPGITDKQAQAMLDTVAQRLMKDHTSDNGYGREWRQRPQGLGFWIRHLRSHFQGSYGSEDLRGTLFGLLGAIGFVLLIVCVNVANLTLARTERRQQELAIRAALGAARVQLMRQLLTESVLLACLGGLGGMVVTYWGMKLLVVLIPQGMPRLKPVQIDGHALGFTLLVSVITGFAFGLAPAWHPGRTRLSNALKQAGTGATAGAGRSKYRSALVITEVALSLVLLTGAGLMIQSVVRLLHVTPGYDPANLLFIRVYLPWKYADFAGDTNQTKQARGLLRNGFFSDAHHRLAALPGVRAAGVLKDAAWGDKFAIEGRSTPVELYSAGCGVEESDCFRAMRVPLLDGRYFEKSDIGDKAGTVILNESAARLCWPGEKAVGKKLRKPERAGDKVYEVVGVVADARLYKYDQPIQPIFFRPYHEFDIVGAVPRFVVRTQQDPRDLIRAIHKELKAVEPAMLTPEIKVVQQVLYDSTVAQRTYMIYLVVFAGVGLFLAALGIYGVLAYSVARRTREIGIRLALGADRCDVLGMVIIEGARLVIIGVAVGLLAAFCLTRLVRNQLFGVSPTDPVVLAEVVLVVLAVALLACFLPARRATRVDPMEALRYE